VISMAPDGQAGSLDGAFDGAGNEAPDQAPCERPVNPGMETR